jgi:ribonucleoside-triphosphate reductase (formate)
MVKGERVRCEIYSRVVGYLRPITQWNDGKREEFKDRVVFSIENED